MKQRQFPVCFGLHTFPLQVIAELRHVVGTYREDVERLQQANVIRVTAVQRCAPLEASFLTSQNAPRVQKAG